MAVLLTDLIKDIEATVAEGQEDIRLALGLADLKLILFALRRFDQCDGNHP
jgi:hypothetical protein